MKITTADTAFSKCVRERANWTCERCGHVYTPPTQALHCSHFIGRGNWATRFIGANAFAHCYGCHSFFEQNPDAFREWVRGRMGTESYEVLIRAADAHSVGKWAHREVKEIAAHYRDELKKMQARRALGKSGRINFDDWCDLWLLVGAERRAQLEEMRIPA